MCAKRRNLVEKAIETEMDEEIRNVKREEKMKARGKAASVPTKVSASFSFGVTTRDVDAILKRYVKRGELTQVLADRLYYALSGNIVELTASQELEGDSSAGNIKLKTEIVKEMIFEQLIDRILSGIWIKTRVE